MAKIGLVVDSTAYLSPEQRERYQIELVPVNVCFEGKVYRDGVDLTPKQAYEFLQKNPEDWATSAPSPGDFLAAYKKLTNKGFKEILCLAPPQKLSAIWNSARMAKEIAKAELPEVKIEVIDSGTGVVGETIIMLRIGQAIEEGVNLEEAIRLANELKSKVRVFLLLDTIRYIYRSGRIPELAAKIGGLLPLKPILGLFGGKMSLEGATISREKSREKIIKILKETWDENYSEIGIMYINNQEEAEKLKEKISALVPLAKVFISEFSPIFGYATGPETLGIGFFAK